MNRDRREKLREPFNGLSSKASLQHRSRRKRIHFRRMLSIVVAIVVLFTTYAMVAPALTARAETFCGQKEHTHTDACYEDVLICGQEESDMHQHDESCYEKQLVCDEKEHVHDASCYTDKNATENEDVQPALEVLSDQSTVTVADEQTGVQTKIFEGDDYTVTASYGKEAGLPDDVRFDVREIHQDTKSKEEKTEYDTYYEQTEEILLKEGSTLSSVRFFDITFMDGDEPVEPNGDVDITITYKVTEVIDEDTQVKAVHLPDEKTTDIIDVETTGDETSVESVSFTSDSFSVYGVVYTVDFHYEVNGKMYDFSIPGGGFISLQHLVELLGINNSSAYNENGSESAENGAENADYNAGEESDIEGTTTYSATDLNALEISEETKQFVGEVASVEFSSPELVWVGKVESDSTVGSLKEANGLDCAYSAELTEEEIEEINSSTVEAGDWALISMQPFTSEESLMITMINGDQWTVKVTDAKVTNGEIASGKKYIIYMESGSAYNGGKGYIILKNDNTQDIVSYDTDLSSLAEGYWWTISANGNAFYIVGRNGQYLNLKNPKNDKKSIGFSASTSPSSINIPQYSDGKGFYMWAGKDSYEQKYWVLGWDSTNKWKIVDKSIYDNDSSKKLPRIYLFQQDVPRNFTVTVDDASHGAVSGFNVDGGQEISKTSFTAPGMSLGATYYNTQRIVATSKAGWKFKEWQLRKSDGTVVATYSGAENRMILPNSIELPYENMTLVAVYEEGDEPAWGAGTGIDELLSEWKKSLTTESIKTDKTAQVYDYENRIYRIDLAASSGRRAANPSVVINFITDTSRSMFFPADITQVGTFDNTASGGLYKWLTTGDDKTGNVYYVIADQEDSATMYAVYYDDSSSDWKIVDASYYNAEDNQTTTIYSVETDIAWREATDNEKTKLMDKYQTGTGWRLSKDGTVFESVIYQAPTRIPGQLWTRLDYLCIAVEKATELIYELDPHAEVHLTTFNKTGSYVGQFGQSRDEIESMLRLISLSGGTRQDLGLQATIDKGIFSNSSSKQQVAVLITDGAPNIKGSTTETWEGVWSKIATNANTLKGYTDTSGNNLSLWTLGLFMSKVGQNGGKLDSIASTGKYRRAESSEEIAWRIEDIMEGILQEVNLYGTVTDTIDPAFYPVDASGNPLKSGDTITVEGKTGTIGWDSTSNCYTVTWADQNINWPVSTDEDGNITQHGWTGAFYVKAKEDFLGGNTISTNTGAKAEASQYLFGGQTYDLGTTQNPITVSVDFDTPYVNVDELSLNQNDTKWTVYLGTEVDPLAQLKKLWSEIKISEVVTASVTADGTGKGIGSYGLPSGSSQQMYTMTANDTSNDTRSTISGKTAQTIPISDLVTKIQGSDLTDAQWTTLITTGSLTLNYAGDVAYGHGDSTTPVGTITISLTQNVVTGEPDLYDETTSAQTSPHDTTVAGEGNEEVYTLTVTYTPTAVQSVEYHTTSGGSAGAPTDAMASTNPHTIDVFVKGLHITKTDESYSNVLTGAKFILYRTARNGETGTTITGLDGSWYPAATLDCSSTGVASLASVERLRSEESYYLVETEIPAGYNGISPVPVTLTINDYYIQPAGSTNEIDKTQTKPSSGLYDWLETATLSLDVTSNVKRTSDTTNTTDLTHSGITADSANGIMYYRIANTTGYELPATGGPGTNLICLIGLMLTACAGAGLVMKKRRRNAS